MPGDQTPEPETPTPTYGSPPFHGALIVVWLSVWFVLPTSQAAQVISGMIVGYFLPPLIVSLVKHEFTWRQASPMLFILAALVWMTSVSFYFVGAFAGSMVLSIVEMRQRSRRGVGSHSGGGREYEALSELRRGSGRP